MYEVQAALRLLHARGGNATSAAPSSTRARVSDAVELVRGVLPLAHPLLSNAPIASSDELQLRMGDAGVADMLLSPVDVPYTRVHAT